MALTITARASSPRIAARGAWLAAGCAAAIAGWAAADQMRLETPGPYHRSNVVRAIPDGFPALEGAEITSAGAGVEFAYRVEYRRAESPMGAVAALHSAPDWSASATSTLEHIELLHYNARGLVDYIAQFSVEEGASTTTIIAEFSPLPLKLAPPRRP
jgi:hypothetical protein